MTIAVTTPPRVAPRSFLAASPVLAVNPYAKGGLRELMRSAADLFAYQVPHLAGEASTLSTPWLGSGYSRTHHYRVPNPWYTSTATSSYHVEIWMDIVRDTTGGTWDVEVRDNAGALITTLDLTGAVSSGMEHVATVAIDDTDATLEFRFSLDTYSMSSGFSYVQGIYIFPEWDGTNITLLPDRADNRYRRDIWPVDPAVVDADQPCTVRNLDDTRRVLVDIYSRPCVVANRTERITITQIDGGGGPQKASTDDGQYAVTNASDDHVYFLAVPVLLPPGYTTLKVEVRSTTSHASGSVKGAMSTGETGSVTATSTGWKTMSISLTPDYSGEAYLVLRGAHVTIDALVVYAERIA